MPVRIGEHSVTGRTFNLLWDFFRSLKMEQWWNFLWFLPHDRRCTSVLLEGKDAHVMLVSLIADEKWCHVPWGPSFIFDVPTYGTERKFKL